MSLYFNWLLTRLLTTRPRGDAFFLPGGKICPFASGKTGAA
jgi:hypothetical protein